MLVQFACVVAYVVSLALPALLFARSYPPTQSGLDVLAKGALGLIVLDPRWLANVCFAWCVVANTLGRAGWRMAALGTLLVVASITLPITYFPNDAGVRVQSLGPGAWLWTASLGVTFAISAFGLARRPVGAAIARHTSAAWLGSLAIVAVAALLLSRSALFPGHARFEALCQNATVRFEVPVVRARSVYFEDDNVVRDGESIIPERRPIATELLLHSDIDFVERGLHESGQYENAGAAVQRLSVPPRSQSTAQADSASLQLETTSAPTADYLVRATDLSEPAIDESLGGARIEVFERRSGRRVAIAQHYWRGNPRETCPRPDGRKFDPVDFLRKALGVREARTKGPE